MKRTVPWRRRPFVALGLSLIPIAIAFLCSYSPTAADPGSETYVFVLKWGAVSPAGQFKYPYGVAVDDDGNVYVADTHNDRIQKFMRVEVTPTPTSPPTATPMPTQISTDMIPVGIEGEVKGSVSLQLPPGYELYEAVPKEGTWGEETVSWTDYDHHGTRVLDTMTAPDGSQHSGLGEQADGIGFGGGILFIRGPVDIQAEAEQYLRPYVEGTIYGEGAITVPGDGASYPGYYYLSTSTKEHTSIISPTGERIEYRWTSVHHHLNVRVGLSQSRPLYTVTLWGWTWGLSDGTDERGWRHTYTIDGKPQLAQHEEYVKDMLTSIRISGWKAPSAPGGTEREVTGSDWLDAIPLPTEVSTEPEVVGTNLGLALFFALAFGLASALFNATLNQNEELIQARLAPLLAPLRRAAERLPRPAEGRRIRIAQPILLLLFSALLYAFLDPGFGISASAAIILLSLFVALAVLVYSYEGTQALLGARFYKLRARFQLFPIALAFGVACVLLTRWMDFHPGYLYGFVAGFAFLGMEAETPRRWALLVLAGAGALLAASLAAWGLAVPVSRLAEGGLPGASVLYGVLVAIFVAGLEGLLFTLVPLTFMDGSKVMAWSRAVWGVAFGLAAWLFFHVLINPGSAYLEALTSKKVLLMLGTLAAYGFLTVATWLFFRWYAGRRAAPRAPVEVEEPTPPPEGEAAIEPAEPPPTVPPEEPTRPSEVPPVREKRERERIRIRRPRSLSVMAISNFVVAALFIIAGIAVMLVPYEGKPTMTVVELIIGLPVFLAIAALPALVGWATWTQKGWVYYILLIQGILLLPALLFIPGALWLSTLGKPRTKIALGRIGDKEKAALKPLAHEAMDAGRLDEALALFRLYLHVNPRALDTEEIESLVSKIEARLRPALEAPAAPEIPAVEAPVPPVAPPAAAPTAPPRPELVAPVRPEVPEARVICPKCQARNSPARQICNQCRADLLPGRSIGERIGNIAVAIFGSILCFVLAGLCGRVQGLQCLVWYLFIQGFVVLIGGLKMAFGRTLEYEKYVKRGQRHIEAEPEQALADFTKALELAPEKERGKIFQQRAEICKKLGRESEELEKLVRKPPKPAPPAQPVKAKGRLRRVCAWVTNFLAGACLVFFVGIAWGTGRDYAKGIPSYALGEEIRVGLIFLLVTLTMALLSILLAERKMLVAGIWSVAIGLAIVAGAVIAGPELRGELPKLALPQVELPFGVAKAPPAEMPTPTFSTFQGHIFSFEYPSGWKRISEGEADAARKMLSLGGAAKYVDGVYTGGLFTGRGLGLIVVMVIDDPRLPGTLTDAHFSQLKAAYERQMGSGLLSMEEAQVGSMSGVELELLQSGMRIWLLLVFSGEEGRAYEFGCAASEGSFDDHLPVFERARSTLRIAAPTPVAPTPPTPTAPATPSPTVPAPMPPSEVITYTIQAGDTLSGIAAEFGVTVDAIAEANDIEDPSLIRVGQVLVIPGPGPRE